MCISCSNLYFDITVLRQYSYELLINTNYRAVREVIDTYSRWIGSSGQYIEQVHGRHKVESWKCQTLCLQILGKSLLTDGELFLNLLKTIMESWSTCCLDNVL